MNSIPGKHLRIAAALAFLCIGGGCRAWHAFATDDVGQANPGPAAVAAPPSRQPPGTDRSGDPLPPGATMRLGTVRFRQFPNINHVVYSPDGQLVVTDSQEDYLQVWDARDGRKLRRIDVGMEQVRDFVFSPNGESIATVGFGFLPERNLTVCQLILIDMATGRPVCKGEWNTRGGVDRLAYAPDGAMLVTTSRDGTLRLWDTATARIVHEEPTGVRNLSWVAFSPIAASHLLAIGFDREIRLWDTAHFRHVRKIAIDGARSPTGLAFSPDGVTLASGIKTNGAEVRLWSASDGSLLRRLKSQKTTSARQVAFSPDGKLIATAGLAGPLVLFGTGDGNELDSFGKEFDLLGDSFNGDSPMAFSPDGSTLATLGGRQALHFWDLTTRKDRLTTPEAHQGAVYALTFPADGKILISGSDDRTVRVWDLATGRPVRTLTESGWVRSLAVCPDGSFLATGLGYPANVNLWNLHTGKRLHTWPVANATLRGLTLSVDRSSATVALADGSLRCWDLLVGKERGIAQPELKRPLNPTTTAALPPVAPHSRLTVFSRLGESKVMVRPKLAKQITLADGNYRPDPSTVGATVLWLDSATEHVRRELDISQADVQRLAFSPDEQYIAVGTMSAWYPPAKGTIRIFRLRDKREVQTIESPCAWINALCFTPDGKRIAAGLQDTSIVLWDVRSVD